VAQIKLAWQSKLILLVVVPAVTIDVAVKSQWWATQQEPVAVWTLGLSILLALITWKLRAATPLAAATGAAITCNLMFSTLVVPYQPWHTALIPVLAVSVLAFATTAMGRTRKERLGTAEKREGRSAAQVAANLGVAALLTGELGQTWIADNGWFLHSGLEQTTLFAAGLAALAEAAADTVSSEAGQVFGGRPRMVTTLRRVEPGADGAVSLAGTLAGILAAGIVASVGTLALGGNLTMFWVSCAGSIFGVLFDSLLGATCEEWGWLNNDAVNFLSTASAAAFTLGVVALLPHLGVGHLSTFNPA
jgi:uncharacterized protein (TIGR00297 family)